MSRFLALAVAAILAAAVPAAAQSGDGSLRGFVKDGALPAAQLSKTVKMMGNDTLEAGLGIFNVFNTGAHTQWNTGAQRVGTALYQSRFNRHPPRAFQLTVGYKF